jgi:hypothetical protein
LLFVLDGDGWFANKMFTTELKWNWAEYWSLVSELIVGAVELVIITCVFDSFKFQYNPDSD